MDLMPVAVFCAGWIVAGSLGYLLGEGAARRRLRSLDEKPKRVTSTARIDRPIVKPYADWSEAEIDLLGQVLKRELRPGDPALFPPVPPPPGNPGYMPARGAEADSEVEPDPFAWTYDADALRAAHRKWARNSYGDMP